MKVRVIAGAIALALAGAGLALSAPSAASAEEAPSYHVVIWEASLNLSPKFPQAIVHDELTGTIDVHALDSYATKCNTTYQTDVYANNATTDALVASGTLTGAGESWPGDGSYQSSYSNVLTTAACPVVVPTPPAAQVCTNTGAYHESDDNLAVLTDAGVDITSAGDGKPTDWGYSVTGNAQGISGIDWPQDKIVGNGIFFRLIFDLSADGGSGYNSFSGLGTHVDQTTVAGYGSKAVFAGKSLADVATTWPHNKLTAVIWQTGSTYAAGDGALLTGVTGDCLVASFITPPTVTPTPPTGDLPTVPVAPTESLAFTGTNTAAVWGLGILSAALVLLGAGLLFIKRRRTV